MKNSIRDSVVGVDVNDVEVLKPLGKALNEPVKRKKVPRRVLHFSDGTLEEYSSDEDEDTPDSKKDNQIAHVDPRLMTWFPWLWYQAATAASQTLQVCDSVGESLASFFGITTPKYQYEIEEYHRIVAEEKEIQKRWIWKWVDGCQVKMMSMLSVINLTHLKLGINVSKTDDAL